MVLVPEVSRVVSRVASYVPVSRVVSRVASYVPASRVVSYVLVSVDVVPVAGAAVDSPGVVPRKPPCMPCVPVLVSLAVPVVVLPGLVAGVLADGVVCVVVVEPVALVSVVVCGCATVAAPVSSAAIVATGTYRLSMFVNSMFGGMRLPSLRRSYCKRGPGTQAAG